MMKFCLPVLIIICFLAVSCQSDRDRLLNEIKKSEKVLLSDSLRMNDSTAVVVVKQYQDFATKFPDDQLSPECLFKAGQVSNGLDRSADAITILTDLVKKYPDFKKAAESVFMCGFIAESKMQDKELAMKYYQEVIANYPTSNLKEQAELSIQNMDKSLEDLVKEFEAKNAR